jgi:hypothetical protein
MRHGRITHSEAQTADVPGRRTPLNAGLLGGVRTMNATRITIHVLAVSLLGAQLASAQAVTPPPYPFTGAARGNEPSAERGLVRIVRIGSYPVELEATRLDDIRDHIGLGQSHQAGDASEFVRWYCYSEPKAILWLLSGELGGGEILTGVVAQTVGGSDRRRGACPALPETSRPVTLGFGWLGSSRKALEASLGSPSLVEGEWLGFFFSGKEPGLASLPGHDEPVKVEFDVSSSVAVRVREGVVVELHASRTKTY